MRGSTNPTTTRTRNTRTARISTKSAVDDAVSAVSMRLRSLKNSIVDTTIMIPPIANSPMETSVKTSDGASELPAGVGVPVARRRKMSKRCTTNPRVIIARLVRTQLSSLRSLFRWLVFQVTKVP